MELKLAGLKQAALVYERDLRAAFPPAELKPWSNIQAMCRDGCYRPWCLFKGEEIIGACFLWLGRPGWALLDYLCVAQGRRNSGAGSVMLAQLRRAEAGAVVLVESEAPQHAPDPDLAGRRLGFYARNGLRTAGYDTDVFGVHYNMLYLSDRPIPDEVLISENRFIYQSRFSREKYLRYVRIPRNAAAGPLPQTPWSED